MSRPFNPTADALLNISVPVLDHGIIMPLDYMGTDNEIVQSARVIHHRVCMAFLPEIAAARTEIEAARSAHLALVEKHGVLTSITIVSGSGQ